jgi:hypothetical protein
MDARIVIYLSDDHSSWTPDELQVAYDKLSCCSADDYSSYQLERLGTFGIHRDDFAGLCDHLGWARPKFWFRTEWPNQGARAYNNAVVQCRRWLAERAANPDHWMSKSSRRDEALRKFPRLTGRAFDRIWEDLAPEAWKAARRPKDRSRSAI